MRRFWLNMNLKSIVLFVSFFLAVLSFVASESTAQVELFILRDGKTTKRTGSIAEWKGHQIVLVANGRERKIDSRTVVDISTNWPSDLQRARELASDHDYVSAAKKFQSAILQEDRLWVQQLILAELIEVYDAQELPNEAIQAFLRMVAKDSESRFFSLIPLSWSTGGIRNPPEAMTQQWIQSKSKILKLIGASWRLSGAKRKEAIETLQSLANDTDLRIAQLATTQLWRTQLFTATQVDTERWSRQMDQIQVELRAGPLFLLGEAYQKTGQDIEARLSWMKIPILYPEKKSLAAFALFRCASLLENSSSQNSVVKNQAEKLWNELVQEHPSSQFYAQDKLKK